MTQRMIPGSLALALVLSACAGTRPGPADALTAYTAALREGRFSDAYRLLSSEARRALSYEDFERLARDNPEEVRETVRWLERIDTAAPVRARLDLVNGETITLVEENGQWRLDPEALDFYGQHTPRQAARSFVRALMRRRYDVLLRFVPRRLAQGLSADSLRQAWEQGAEADEVHQMARALHDALEHGRAPEVIGDRATFNYGPGNRWTMLLLREDGVWKIEDPG